MQKKIVKKKKKIEQALKYDRKTGFSQKFVARDGRRRGGWQWTDAGARFFNEKTAAAHKHPL